MDLLAHHIYEYKKGLRELVLHTMKSSEMEYVIRKLESYQISFHIQKVTNTKINIFFGAEECVTIVKNICDKNLSFLTNEEDFILGIMLGYDRKKQCERYIARENLLHL